MLITLILSVLLLQAQASPVVGTSCAVGRQSPIEIPIKDMGENGNTPRQLSSIPLSAIIIAGFIQVSFSGDFGYVDINVENTTTGTFSHYQADSGIPSASIPAPSSSGNYSITFTLSSGQVYFGEFTI